MSWDMTCASVERSNIAHVFDIESGSDVALIDAVGAGARAESIFWTTDIPVTSLHRQRRHQVHL